MRSCGEGFRKSGEPKIRRSEDPKLRRGFHKIWKVGDKYNSLFKEICYTKMPTKYLPIQCHEDPKIRRSEDARQEQCPPSATCLKLGGVNRPAPPNKLQQPNTKSIHRLSLTHLPLFVCRLPASVTSPWT